MNTQSTSHSLKIQTRLSALLLVLAVALLATNIIVEDEPGAIPLLAVLVATAWLVITRVRVRRAGKALSVESPV